MKITDTIDLATIGAEEGELKGTVSVDTALSFHLRDYDNWQKGGFQKIFSLLDEESKVRMLYLFYINNFEKAYVLEEDVSLKVEVKDYKAMIKEKVLSLPLENGETFKGIFKEFDLKNPDEQDAWSNLDKCIAKSILEGNADVLKKKNNCGWKLRQFNLPLDSEDIESSIEKIVPIDGNFLMGKFNLNTFSKANIWDWYENGMGIKRKAEWINEVANKSFVEMELEEQKGNIKGALLLLGIGPVLKLSVMAARCNVPNKDEKLAKMFLNIMKSPYTTSHHMFSIPSAIKYYVDNLKRENVEDIDNNPFVKGLSLEKWSTWGFEEKISKNKLKINVVPPFLMNLSRMMELNKIKDMGLDLPSTLFGQDMSNIKGHKAGAEEERPSLFLDELISVMKKEGMCVDLTYKMDSLYRSYNIQIVSPNQQVVAQIRDVLVKFFWLSEPVDKLIEEIKVGETERLMRKDLKESGDKISSSKNGPINSRKF